MVFPFFFTLIAAGLLFLAWNIGGAGWLLAWPAGSFLLLTAAYAGLGPGVLGKRPDGRIAWRGVLPSLPYLLPTWLIWHVLRRLTREPCCHEVVPGLWIGRRPFPRELPPGVDLIVDLTAEFSEPRGVRTGRTYVCLPTLDARAPSESALRQVVRQVMAWPGTVYVHCAAGHGRSALVVAAVLLARGVARDAREAVRLLRGKRPGVSVRGPQRRLLERLAAVPDGGG